mmetsp:Transcript_9124/g.27964  ORF Transcript_9124/g.27964 Transcript_9124/m.27964 type:complete len:250 (-) Transcript_9124:291-1040(-)
MFFSKSSHADRDAACARRSACSSGGSFTAPVDGSSSSSEFSSSACCLCTSRTRDISSWSLRRTASNFSSVRSKASASSTRRTSLERATTSSPFVARRGLASFVNAEAYLSRFAQNSCCSCVRLWPMLTWEVSARVSRYRALRRRASRASSFSLTCSSVFALAEPAFVTAAIFSRVFSNSFRFGNRCRSPRIWLFHASSSAGVTRLFEMVAIFQTFSNLPYLSKSRFFVRNWPISYERALSTTSRTSQSL